jgi:hypothetical protein
MIELFDTDKKDINRKSSKGNQLKWNRDNIWYKADYTGYEGLSEYVISHLIMSSSLNKSEYVIYEQEQIRYKSSVFMGVSCKDFLKPGEQLITLERLFQNTFGVGLNNMVYHISDHEERLKFIVEKTQELTGISGLGKYMAKLLTIDAFFLNEDRHTHNIAVIADADGKYRTCPIFDQGAGLLADTTMDYPLTSDVYDLIDSVTAKTFCQDFDEQLEIAERLYERSISFTFTKNDVNNLLMASIGYEQNVCDRVRDIIFEQMRKYGYLFDE